MGKTYKIFTTSISNHLQVVSLHATPQHPIAELPSSSTSHSSPIPMVNHHYPPCDNPLPILNPTPTIQSKTTNTTSTTVNPNILPNHNLTPPNTTIHNAKTLVHNLQRKPPDQPPTLSLPTLDHERPTSPTTYKSADIHFPNTTTRISTPIVVRDGATGILSNLYNRSKQSGDNFTSPEPNSPCGDCHRKDETRDGGSDSVIVVQHLYTTNVGTHKALIIDTVTMGLPNISTAIQLQ